METITIPKKELERLRIDNRRLTIEVETLHNTPLYRRLLECLENLKKREYTRKDVGI